MFNKETVIQFWDTRSNKRLFSGKNYDPCHYNNKWQDEYIFKKRTKALKKLTRLFSKAKTLVDIGCGAGTYTEWLAKQIPGKTMGIDRSTFLPLVDSIVNYKPGQLTSNYDMYIAQYIHQANIVTLLTVYDFLPLEYRSILISYLSYMEQGAHVLLLDINMDKVSSYQRDLDYKLVETRTKKIHDFMNAGFDLEQEIPVDYIDSKVFHYLRKELASPEVFVLP